MHEFIREEIAIQVRRFLLDNFTEVLVTQDLRFVSQLRQLLHDSIEAEGRKFFRDHGAEIMQAFMREYIDDNLDGISDGAALRSLNTQKFADVLQRSVSCTCKCKCVFYKREPRKLIIRSFACC